MQVVLNFKVSRSCTENFKHYVALFSWGLWMLCCVCASLTHLSRDDLVSFSYFCVTIHKLKSKYTVVQSPKKFWLPQFSSHMTTMIVCSATTVVPFLKSVVRMGRACIIYMVLTKSAKFVYLCQFYGIDTLFGDITRTIIRSCRYFHDMSIRSCQQKFIYQGPMEAKWVSLSVCSPYSPSSN